MKILITGGLGYIGSHTVQVLTEAGHQVVIFDKNIQLPEKIKDVALFQGDIRNKEDLQTVFSHTKFDAVVHCAAKIEVRESQTNPGLYYENNVLGTIVLLEAIRKHNIKSLVFSSTASIYDQNQAVPFTEQSAINPINTYAQTKLVIEKMLESYHKAYGLNVIILRYFNAAGASLDGSLGEDHQPETHLIPIAIKAAIEGTNMTVNGNELPTPDGTAIRDFVHVLDIAQAHLLALEYIHFNNDYQIFNIGSGQGYSIKQVLKMVEEVSGKTISITYGPPKDGDPVNITASADKIKQKLGWSPQYSELKTIIQTAYHWHKRKS